MHPDETRVLDALRAIARTDSKHYTEIADEAGINHLRTLGILEGFAKRNLAEQFQAGRFVLHSLADTDD